MDHSERIAEINDILRTGAKTVVVEGNTVTYDFDSLRRERTQLLAEDAQSRGRRPRIASINIGASY